VGQLACALRQRLRLAQQAPGARKQRRAGRGEPHAARVAHEQRHAKLLLQAAHLARQRWLRDGQARGGAPEMERLGQRDEVPQGAKVHGAGRRGTAGWTRYREGIR
jgi:hypothetical protein